MIDTERNHAVHNMVCSYRTSCNSIVVRKFFKLFTFEDCAEREAKEGTETAQAQERGGGRDTSPGRRWLGRGAERGTQLGLWWSLDRRSNGVVQGRVWDGVV